MIPTEVITLLGSVVTGSVVKLIGVWANTSSKRAEADLTRAKAYAKRRGIVQKGFEAARKMNGGEWTRRLIVLAAMLAFLAPVFVPAFKPEVSVAYVYEQEERGKWVGQGRIDKMEVKTFQGGQIVILPMHWHVVISICGLYFGAAFMKRFN